ncbi:MAG: exodeoxyribonuclease VII small subunit [Synechococcaceae cyanobacterium]|nr:exodeoxyribonuclease VII small subunit [Synechococcaceae cyanobacterium]
MASRPSPSPDQKPSSTARRRSRSASADGGAATSQAAAREEAADGPAEAIAPEKFAPEEMDIAADLNFREAQTALELSLAELQAPELDVEQMAGLYRRASRYADRCEQLLQLVEQEVMQWDPERPQDSPEPYQL